jgi:hypothetical protein
MSNSKIAKRTTADDSHTTKFEVRSVEPAQLSEKGAQEVRRIKRWEDESAANLLNHLDD